MSGVENGKEKPKRKLNFPTLVRRLMQSRGGILEARVRGEGDKLEVNVFLMVHSGRGHSVSEVRVGSVKGVFYDGFEGCSVPMPLRAYRCS